MRRLLSVLAIAGGLCAPRAAAASCQFVGPYLGTGPRLPLGCPLHVYTGLGPFGPLDRRVTALRGGAYADVTGTLTSEVVELAVERTELDCQLQVPVVRRFEELLQLFTLQPIGVAVGERIGFGSGWIGGIEIVEAGPCAAPVVPALACTETAACGPPPIQGLEPAGCGARGGGGLVIGVALLGLLRRARRHRRR